MEYLEKVNKRNIKENYELFMNKIEQKSKELDKRLKNKLRPFDERNERNRIIRETKKKLNENWNGYKSSFKPKREILFGQLKNLKAFNEYIDVEIERFEELKPGDIISFWDNLEEEEFETSVVENSYGCIKFYKEYYDGCEDNDLNNFKPNADKLYTYYYTTEKYFDNDVRFCCLICRKCLYNEYEKTKDFKYCVKKCNLNNTYAKETISCKCKSFCDFKDISINTGKFWLTLPDINVINEIKSILNESGDLQPDIMKDHTAVVLHYTKQFATECKEKMEEFLFELDNDIRCFFTNQIANEEIKSIVEEIFNLTKKEVDKDIKKLHIKNSILELISTPNSHYLSENILRAIKRNDTLAEDDGYYKIANCEVEAFVKVQSKYIIERTDDIFNLYYYHMIKRMIDNFNDYEPEDFSEIEHEFLEPLEKIQYIQVENDEKIDEEREKALHDKKILDAIKFASGN